MQMTNCHWDREQKQHQTEVYWAFRCVIISRVLCQELQKTSFKPVDSQDRGFPHCPAVSKQPNWQNKIYYILYNMRDTRWLWLCSHLKYSFAGLLVSLQAMVDSTVRFEPGTISSSGTCTGHPLYIEKGNKHTTITVCNISCITFKSKLRKLLS